MKKEREVIKIDGCAQCDKKDVFLVRDIYGDYICRECLEENNELGHYDKQD